MADVSHTSAGYSGTVDQVAEANRFVLATLPFRVGSSADWAVTVNTGANLTVNIAAGTGMACGVRDATSSTASLTAASNATGSTRYDVIVASFNWTTGVTSFGIVQGTTSLPAINTGGSAVATSVNRIPGVQYDAVLAVLQVRNGVGVLSTTDLFDSRVWGGMAGYGYIPTATYLSMVDARAGTEVHAVDTKQRWRFDGSSWGWPRGPQGVLALLTYSNSTPLVLSSGFATLGAFTKTGVVLPANRMIRLSFTATIASDAADTQFLFAAFMNTGAGGQVRNVTIDQRKAATQYPVVMPPIVLTPAAGTWQFQIGAQRVAGTGNTTLASGTPAEGAAEFVIEDIGAAS